ncbi:hypothetical protein PTTG_29571, partial [Puccinia triticina 1-1 BBBD Race 1]
FDGCLDTPVEVLHVFLLGVVKYLVGDFMQGVQPAVIPIIMAHYQSFSTDGLNIPLLQPYYLTRHFTNFIRKDYKIVLQAAPFVLFEYMDESNCMIWTSLCQLVPLVFQTHIEDMDTYQHILKLHIGEFLYHLMMLTAQWMNKPKFHMLLHLPDAILCFGPPPLYATEKFESYNGIFRNASIHSNQNSPGKDIGHAFGDFQNLRHLYFGGVAGEQHKVRIQSIPAAGPRELYQQLPDFHLVQLAGYSLNPKDVIRDGSFVLYKSNNDSDETELGRVEHVWEARKPGRVLHYICLTRFKLSGVDSFYNMREVCNSGQGKFINARNLRALVNVQHNCHKANYVITFTKAKRVERQETSKRTALKCRFATSFKQNLS